MSRSPRDEGGHRAERGVGAVLRALASLPDPPPLDGLQDDPLRLADVLLDFEAQMVPRRVMELLVDLRFDGALRRAEREIERRWLFVDPVVAANRALTKVFMDTLTLRRIRPYASLEERAVAWAVSELRRDPTACAFEVEDATPEERRAQTAVARFLNGLDDEVRRIAWLNGVRRLSIPEVARQTGVPYERVEFLLQRLTEGAERAVREALADGDERRADDGDQEAEHGG